MYFPTGAKIQRANHATGDTVNRLGTPYGRATGLLCYIPEPLGPWVQSPRYDLQVLGGTNDPPQPSLYAFAQSRAHFDLRQWVFRPIAISNCLSLLVAIFVVQ